MSEFSKFYEMGYDKQREKWANEIIIEAGYGRAHVLQLPSDVKAGHIHSSGRDLHSLHVVSLE